MGYALRAKAERCTQTAPRERPTPPAMQIQAKERANCFAGSMNTTSPGIAPRHKTIHPLACPDGW